MKLCTKCGITKEISEFNKNKTKPDGLQSKCKECHRKYTREHYKKHKAKYKTKASDYKQRNKDFLEKLKKTLKCSKCGESRHYVLDYHHIDPRQKDFNITWMCHNSYSIKNIKAEINKCIPLCSNCHRELHYLERQSNAD